MAWRVNPAGPARPRGLTGKRVHVLLNNDYTTVGKEPAGWLAEGYGACNWAQDGHPFNIKKFEVIGES